MFLESAEVSSTLMGLLGISSQTDSDTLSETMSTLLIPGGMAQSQTYSQRFTASEKVGLPPLMKSATTAPTMIFSSLRERQSAAYSKKPRSESTDDHPGERNG